jgi:hypothetical protein
MIFAFKKYSEVSTETLLGSENPVVNETEKILVLIKLPDLKEDTYNLKKL